MMNRSFPSTSGIGNRGSRIGSRVEPSTLNPQPSTSNRTGVTLTEVLMALMVMGIGVVSVVTLFPVSLLRSIEATKLTNATLLRQNAEARLETSVSPQITATSPTTGVISGSISPAILRDPDRDGNALFSEHFGEKFVFDPLGAWMMIDYGYSQPTRGYTVDQRIEFRDDRTYHANQFGNDSLGVGLPPIRRYTFGLAEGATSVQGAINAAEKFVTLPDSFITIFEGIAGTFTYAAGPPATITFTNPILGEYSVGQDIRVTAFDSGNQTSVVIKGDVVDSDGDTVSDAISLHSPIPFSPLPDRLIVDIPERRYTWIATVRGGNEESPGSTSVAVFFRRSFSPDDEKVYALTEPAGSYNVFEMARAPNNITSNSLGEWEGLPPGFERGGWMFDLNEFRWWKITDIQDTGTGFRFATDPEQIDKAEKKTLPVRAIFPQNVIEVYTLKSSASE